MSQPIPKPKSIPGSDRRPTSLRPIARPTTPHIRPIRPAAPSRPPAIQAVRVEQNQDGSFTYHFTEEQGQTDPRVFIATRTAVLDRQNGSSVGQLPPHKAHAAIGPSSLLDPNGLNAVNGKAPSYKQLQAAWAQQSPGRSFGGEARSTLQTVDLDEVVSTSYKLEQQQVDYVNSNALFLLRTFSDYAKAGQLDDALKVLEEIIHANRHDVLPRLMHKHFLRPAADQRAVKQALRFVQLLPRKYADARTYNMVVTVCARAGDVLSALHAADMLKSTGSKLDTVMYTNLITVCAAAGKAEQAFKLYAELRAEKLPTDSQVYSALIAACSNEIMRLQTSDRRRQLVLMERAFGVMEDLREARLVPDLPVWNALISAAGKCGQLQRAFQVLEDMQARGVKANGRTFVTLIDGCTRAQEQGLAVKVYRRALRSQAADSLQVYSAAIGACCVTEPADLDTALSIYADMQRNGVAADTKLYGILFTVAGKAGRLDVAFALHEEMKSEGITPCQATSSALMLACISNDDLERARECYVAMREQHTWPQQHAFNALINALGRAFRLGDAVSVTVDMVNSGIRPDLYTYAALLNACQRANEADLAFELYRIMKQNHIQMDEAIAFPLLRLCFNKLRGSSFPGGLPAGAPSPPAIGASRVVEGKVLMEALSGRCNRQSSLVVDQAERSSEPNWPMRAVGVYRDLLATGAKPSVRLLDRVLACLRVPFSPPKSANGTPPSPFKAGSYMVGESLLVEACLQGGDLLFDPRCISIVEEAVTLGLLPQFRLDEAIQLDLRDLPPAVAEVYVLTIITALQRRMGPRGRHDHPITLVVPPYDPAEVFSPSYQHEAVSDSEAPVPQPLFERVVAAGSGVRNVTGLGVAAMLRRIKMWTEERPVEGIITLHPREITRWGRTSNRAATNARNTGLSILQGEIGFGKSLRSQQRDIRVGMKKVKVSF